MEDPGPDVLARLEGVVREVGCVVRERAREIRVVGLGDPDNPTTDLDRLADDLLRRGLGPALGADAAWLSEECADDPARLTARTVFIVDPLDGTRGLLNGTFEAALSVALWQDGDLRWACVHDPFAAETWTARHGGGAWRDGRRLAVTDVGDPAIATLTVSRHEHERGWLQALAGRVACRPSGSIARKLAMVAEGRADGTLTAHPRHEWDIAAGALLVREAGGLLTDASGAAVAFNRPSTLVGGVVASGGRLHPALLRLVPCLCG